MAGLCSKSLQLIMTLLLLLNTEVFGLPTSQCSLLETLRLTPGSRMELGCKSVCGSEPRKFEWLRSSGINGEASTMQSEDYELVVESVGYEDGGTYKCRCLPDGPQCEQSVYIIPNMDFVASDKHIFAGDSVEFACTVSMLEPKFPTIKLVSGRNLDLSSHEKEESIINGHTVATDVWLYKQEGLKQDYVCEVECYCGEKFMEMLQKNVTIYSYVPPEVAFTTELKLEGKEDFGKPGKVSCSVVSSPDTGCMVNWFFKGIPVTLDQGKYRMQTTDISEDVSEYALLIDDVQETDMGPYVCRLTSDFHLESENEVWISFKENNDQYAEDVRSTTFVYSIFSIVGVVTCALGVWLKHRRNSNDRKRV